MKKLIVKILNIIVMLAGTGVQASAQDFKAEQYVQSASIELKGNIEQVFPLFTPLGEKKWAEGWNPNLIFPSSGEMQEGLIFQTPDHVHGAPRMTWVVSRYSVRDHQIQYIISSAVRVAIISVTCTTSGKDSTNATISYSLTGLSAEGNELSHHLIGKIFATNLKDWETAINSYLK
jgi:uncharacterized lipoprotein YajG